MNKALKNCISKLHLGLNNPLKLNETLIDSCAVFFRVLGTSEASFHEITFSWIPVRQERETVAIGSRHVASLVSLSCLGDRKVMVTFLLPRFENEIRRFSLHSPINFVTT